MLQIIDNILKNYASSVNVPKVDSFSKHHPMFTLVQTDFPKVIQSIIQDDVHYKVEGSVGKGNWTETPWLSIFSKKITLTATKGIYLVYLFKSDMSGFYLSLNQGATYLKNYFKTAEIKQLTTQLQTTLSQRFEHPRFVHDIDLSPNKRVNAKGYEQAHLLGFEYQLGQMPTESILIEDLLYLMDIYREIEQEWSLDQDSIAELYRDLLEDRVSSEANPLTYLDEEGYQKAAVNQSVMDRPIPEAQKSRSRLQNTRTWGRNPVIAAYALSQVGYVCEMDARHETFTLDCGQRYMEGHHLIPVHKQDHLKVKDCGLDTVANIVSLCPNCHRAIHYGSNEHKKEMLARLYLLKEARLNIDGIRITLKDLYDFYEVI